MYRIWFAVLFWCCVMISPVVAAAGDKDTLIYAGENESTINPLLNNHQELPTIIFSGLMKYDAGGRPVPDLAESVSVDEASNTYTFRLRSGVCWHDGRPFTAEDVLYTYEALIGDESLTSSVTSNYEDIASVTSPDDRTVVFTLARPNAAMLDNFTIGILPKHLFAGRDINTAPANYAPVGTGRYRFITWDTAGGYIVLERNDDFYGKVPNIRRIIYKTVAVESTKALMLQSGEADIAWLNARYADRFRGREGFRNVDFQTADYRSCSMDFRSGFWRRNADSIAVLNFAIDKQAVVKSVLAGHGSPAYSPLQKNRYGGNPAADMFPFDLGKFATEMEKLGWKRGPDGIYERNGEKFSFTVQVRDYEEERVDIANVVSHQLRQAGVDMKVVLVTRFDWKAGYNGFLAGFAAEFDPDAVFKDFVTGASDNTMQYSNAEVDRLLRAGRGTLNSEERRRLYGEFEVEYARHPGHLFLAYLDGNYVTVAGLRGLDTSRVLGHHAVGVMWNIEDWTLDRRD